MVNHVANKLGKKPAVYDPRTLKYRAFRTTPFPKPPLTLDYSKGVEDWGMDLNGPNHYKHGVPGAGLGDCVPAAAAHGEEVWTLNAGGSLVKVPNGAVLKKYEAWGGYIPGDPNTDNGCVILQALKGWIKSGFNLHPALYAFVALHEIGNSSQMTMDIEMIKEAMWLFGGVDIGIQLPLAWQTAKVWDVGPANDPNYERNSWGGHSIWFVGYNATGPVAITWGSLVQITWAAVTAYVDEGYACLSRDFISATGLAPSKYNFAALDAALQVVAA